MNSSAQNSGVTTFAERAILLTSRGIPVVPVNAGQKRCTVPDWPKLATTNLDILSRWPSDANSAAVCLLGGICVLDADAAGLVARIEQDTAKTIPQTFTVKSGGKGFPHIYFTHTERSTALGNRHAQGLFDFQADRKYVVGPGSVLENGGTYEITCDAALTPIPDWLCDWIESNSEAEKKPSKGTSVPVHEDFDIDAFLTHYGLGYDVQGNWYITDVCPIAGHRHEQSTQTGFYFDGETFGFHCFAGNCAGAGMTVGQVIKKLNEPDARNIRPPYAGPIWKELTESPRSFPYTEGGNAERLVAEHRNSFRYLLDDQVWLHYDGRRWKFDAAAEIHAAAKATVRHMSHLAADIKDDEERKRFKGWALVSDRRSVRENTVALARYEEGFKALRVDFDQYPWKLNVLNGTLDLKTGKLLAHDREDRLTQLTRVVFDPWARCPRWLQFLSETFPERDEIIPFLQRSVGYTLTGDTSEQHFWLMLGSGRNGKTVFLNVVKALLGEYAAETSFATFSAKRNDAAINPRDGLAALRGARFVKASESGEAKRFDDALLKAVTGGDTVRTANMYETDFSYVPQFKIWLASNHEPQVTDVSDGLWRRLYRVNFEHQVAEAKQDIHLPAKLEQELPGILNWALAGLREYVAGGMQVPVTVVSAVAQYRHEQNPLREFLEQNYDITGNSADEVIGSELGRRYSTWAKAMRTRALSPTALGMALRGMQIEGRPTRTGKIYSGLKAKTGPQVGI